MSDSGKYSCFFCPQSDFSSKKLVDLCPNCQRPYDFPLMNPPAIIADYKIGDGLGRGFYGAAFAAEKQGLITSPHVLKVVPKNVYNFFGKDFTEECQAHNIAAKGANFIVGISDAFDEMVNFGPEEVDCHVAVLDYVDGCLLQDYFSGKRQLDAASAAQIAADLFSIKNELVARQINHNDFHAGNIMVADLSREYHRREAMCPTIRALAIDLGSLADDRRDGDGYRSDLGWIAQHIESMSEILLKTGDAATDLDERLALELKLIAQSISSSDENQRIDNFDSFIVKIQEAFYRTTRSWKPWRAPFQLRKFDEWTNAQTLDAWNVPQLLVDPEGEWHRSICSVGPLIVTGMRGCGKTMLLRSLQFHARAAQQEEDKNDIGVLERIKKDDYVGLFLSASSLLKTTGANDISPANMFARLAIGYVKSAIESLSHLEDIDNSAIKLRSIVDLGDALSSVILDDEEIYLTQDLAQSERILTKLLVRSCSLDSEVKLSANPAIAFPLLAKAIQKTTDIWSENQVLFLLDDVSTRFLKPDQIEEILSSLIFQDSTCAFKITSETQAIFLSLKSPGGVEPAANWRDFKTFDLGADVHKRLKQKGGKKFLSNILEARAKLYSRHSNHLPIEILGNQTLNEIASKITKSSPNSSVRKSVYHGISALRAVCVGDIGTAITIYENIQSRASGKLPVSQQIQSDAFQQYCSCLIYSLDRRGSNLKAAAKSFAKASYELMMQSSKKKEKRGLRQYSSIYVRITAGDREEQGKKLRELVDAGVFVFQGGGPRTKTKDSDPMLQFKLSFRKVYGLADFVGLSERDRFELSGEDLENWLQSPEKGEEILMRNLHTDTPLEEEEFEEDEDPQDSIKIVSQKNVEKAVSTQQELFKEPTSGFQTNDKALPLPTFLRLDETDLNELVGSIETLVVALGFEDRARESALIAAKRLSPKRVICLRYPDEAGQSKAILNDLKNEGYDPILIDHPVSGVKLRSLFSGSVAVDVTGFSKSAIFSFIRTGLETSGEIIFAYSSARTYYPLEKDLSPIIQSYEDKDYSSLLESLKNVLTGESGPYSIEELHTVTSDSTRMKVLLAFGSAKHERLIQLVEDLNFDFIKVIVDSSHSSRATVGKLAAEVAVRGAQSVSIEECDIKDPDSILRTMERVYRNTYREGGLNFEIGLTGDKLAAVVATAFSSKLPVNKIWYVRPNEFDTKRFTKGLKDTSYFKIIR